MSNALQAAEYFAAGHNCAQAVAMTYADKLGMTPSAAARMASPFGGGMGRMREVCGAFSGMLMVLGALYGYEEGGTPAQQELYARVQRLADEFRERAGSIVCREILKNPPSDPAPTPRTEEFYRQRPCTRLVMLACELLDAFMEENPAEA